MLGSLLAGTAASVRHRLFYRSLNGQATHSTPCDQQVNIAIGTGLAFLVKSLLVMAVGTAYMQLFWKDIQVRSENVAVVDSVFGTTCWTFRCPLVLATSVVDNVGFVSW